MRSRSLNGVSRPVGRFDRRRGAGVAYPTPSQIVFRIGLAVLVALSVALAANVLAAAMGG